MSLISFNELKKLVKDGVITNCPPEMINAASIDVTLGLEILREMPSVIPRVLDLRKRISFASQRIRIDEDHGYTIRPGEFILCCTQQVFNLPSTIACEYKLKSSMARSGLNHLLAGWCDPGWNGSVLTLELHNVLRHNSICIRPGDRIGQVVFFRTAKVPEEATYEGKGRYNGDTSVTGVKP